ncbi:DinB family protein [Geothrix terrae]|uniref:DinB family protein n=1 Tax=Geothrix terrae TaxID=2922720 RepID=UPI001FAD176B|nr:DinB family protein [Geothrix terrae]
MSREIELILLSLDQAYDRKSWHGSNLKGALRGLDAGAAAHRPAPGRPSIHELVVHLAYWKYAVLRQLVDLPRGAFPLKGSNWFPREGPDSAAWKADLALLDRMHRDLRAAVAALDPVDLDRPSAKVQYRIRDLILGVAAHDLHHGGQIQLIKRLGGERR